MINGRDECRRWYGDVLDTEIISTTELQCSYATKGAFSPDIDIDGDCEPDLLSIGFKFWAIPVTIDN